MAARSWKEWGRAPGRIVNVGAHLVRGALDLVYPPGCHLCGAATTASGRASAWACSACRPEPRRGPHCGRCVARLPASLPDGDTCLDCRRRPPAVAPVVALSDYVDPAIRRWILAWKHGGRVDLTPTLAARLAGAWHGTSTPPDVEDRLVPVPLHPWRRLERGFDQAAELARALSTRTGVPVVPALRRERATHAQGAAGSPSRAANVRGAFAPVVECARVVQGRRVWLVDDVWTSGATLGACAPCLRRLGARRVGVLVLARAGAAPESTPPAVASDPVRVDTGPR